MRILSPDSDKTRGNGAVAVVAMLTAWVVVASAAGALTVAVETEAEIGKCADVIHL